MRGLRGHPQRVWRVGCRVSAMPQAAHKPHLPNARASAILFSNSCALPEFLQRAAVWEGRMEKAKQAHRLRGRLGLTGFTGPLKKHYILLAAVAAAAFFLFVHVDVVETANHSWQLLKSTFNGRFFEFYNDVVARGTDLYYINYAHYNIAFYLIFALAELPVFIVCSIFGLAPPATLLYFVGKLVATAFFAGCLPLVARIARLLGASALDAEYAALFTALWPPAFFSVLVMGQYDSICLFFTLLGLYFWLQKKYWVSALWFGAGAACKFFPLMIFIALVLLSHKRVFDILKYLLISLWLLAPTTLLFLGNNGDMHDFNAIMMDRLFAAQMPGSGGIALFAVVLFAIYAFAYLYHPKEADVPKTAVWLCLAVYAALFTLVFWHPQWLLLLAPFIALTMIQEKNRVPWFWFAVLFSLGFFIACGTRFPGQLEANMLSYGVLGGLIDVSATPQGNYQWLIHYYDIVPVLAQVPAILCPGVLACEALFKFPSQKGTPAARLANGASSPPAAQMAMWLWLVFGLGMAAWALPTGYALLKSFL